MYRSFLQPSPLVVARFRPLALVLLDPRRRVIGVHRRMGDAAMGTGGDGARALYADGDNGTWACVEAHVTVPVWIAP